MKKKIAALLLALVLAVSATGCQGAPIPESSTPSTNTTTQADETDQSSAASTVERTSEDGELDEDQYLNVLLADEPTVLDVARFSMIQDRNVFYNVLEPLTRIENGIVTPAGAESWDVSDDGLVYTFHLRENYWSDGQPVTAEDYAGARALAEDRIKRHVGQVFRLDIVAPDEAVQLSGRQHQIDVAALAGIVDLRHAAFIFLGYARHDRYGEHLGRIYAQLLRDICLGHGAEHLLR